MSGFSFKGVHSSKFGIYTQDQSRTLLPPKREGKITIPGRSGYYDDVGAVYNERAESVLCSFVCPEGKTVPGVCREIAYWLSGSGRLIFDREPDKYYLARLSGGPPMSQHLKYRDAPQRWMVETADRRRAGPPRLHDLPGDQARPRYSAHDRAHRPGALYPRYCTSSVRGSLPGQGAGSQDRQGSPPRPLPRGRPQRWEQIAGGRSRRDQGKGPRIRHRDFRPYSLPLYRPRPFPRGDE